MRHSSRYPLLTAVALAALTISGCASPGSGSANEDARIIVARPGQPPSLDPMVSTAGDTSSIAINVIEPLLSTNAEGEIQPILASDYEVSEDGTRYTFHLRDGVTFHDGSSFDAADVVASMERWSRLSGPGKSYFADATWNAEDSLTVVLDLPQASFAVPLALSSSAEQFPGIYPSEVIESASDEPITELIGTGPFALSEWVPDRHLKLDRFDDYQGLKGESDGRAGNRTAQVAGIDFLFVADPSTRVLGLQTGEYDAITSVPYDNAPQVLQDSSLSAFTYPNVLLNLYYNKAEGLFTDVEARRAVDTALDRERIMTAAVGSEEFFTLDPSMMLSSQELWQTSIGEDRYNRNDPKQARTMLDAIEYDGSPLRMITTRDYSEAYNGALVIIEQLAAIGVKVSLETYDWPTFSEIRDDASAWDLAVMPNTPKADPGSLVFLRPDFAGSTQSADLDRILADYRSAPSIPEAQQRYDALQEWFYDYLPVSKIGEADAIVAARAGVVLTTGEDGAIWWATSVTN